MFQICFLNITWPLKRGHFSIQDTSPGPQGIYNRGVPLNSQSWWGIDVFSQLLNVHVVVLAVACSCTCNVYMLDTGA